jgi:hypothetical protein
MKSSTNSCTSTSKTKNQYVNFDTVQSAGLPERFPETLDEAQLAEDLITKGLEKLTLDEHEKILFEMHGIDPELEEGPEMVQQKLEELETELDKVAVNKEAYDLALRLNPSYVKSGQFRLIFLRSRQFDCTKAAALMVQHFEVKRQLFGDGEILAREVHQSDLSDKDEMLLKSGFLQVMPERDASGRTVFLLVTSNFGNNFPEDGWEKEHEVSTILLARQSLGPRRLLSYYPVIFDR